MKVQLNTILFAKTLLRKDVASSSSSTEKKVSDAPVTAEISAATSSTADGAVKPAEAEKKDDAEKDFSSKAQIMTLMTTDVDRVSEFSWHFFALVDAPIEIIIGSLYLYQLLGEFLQCKAPSFVELIYSRVGLQERLVSSDWPLHVVSLLFRPSVDALLRMILPVFLPLNHYASVFVVSAQDNLMKARDERVSLMNEVSHCIFFLVFLSTNNRTVVDLGRYPNAQGTSCIPIEIGGNTLQRLFWRSLWLGNATLKHV